MPIGIFDSGYGGLTVFKEICRLMPEYDYVYLGDNARAPYGTRSFELVHQFTLESVNYLFNLDCSLVILACNTASAKALRTIQQRDLPLIDSTKRVLGVIRPTAEEIGNHTKTRHVGVLGTSGTIKSESYALEIVKQFPDVIVTSHACPMWVPLVENNENEGLGADYFVQKEIGLLLEKDPLIDVIILGCTHYPLLLDKIERYTPPNIRIFSQGEHIAHSLKDYLCRHPEVESLCTKGGSVRFYSTDSPEQFSDSAKRILGWDDVECSLAVL